MLKRNYKITHRDKLFDLSKVNNWKPTKDVFQLNPCPYCDKIPKAFLESRFVRNEDKDEYKKQKWTYDGIYVVVKCKHINITQKSVGMIPKTLLIAIFKWNESVEFLGDRLEKIR